MGISVLAVLPQSVWQRCGAGQQRITTMCVNILPWWVYLERRLAQQTMKSYFCRTAAGNVSEQKEAVRKYLIYYKHYPVG